MEYGVIYKVTNLINNKLYIGQTVNFKKRKERHLYEAKRGKSKLYFSRALKKYGNINFLWEIIDSANSKDELSNKEKYWIDYYDTYNNGYNLTHGGEGISGYVHNLTEDQRNYRRNNIASSRGSKWFYIYNIDSKKCIGEFASRVLMAKAINCDIETIKKYLYYDKPYNINRHILIEKDSFLKDNLDNILINASTFLVFNSKSFEFIGEWNNINRCVKDLKFSKNKIVSGLNCKNGVSEKYIFCYKYFYKGKITLKEKCASSESGLFFVFNKNTNKCLGMFDSVVTFRKSFGLRPNCKDEILNCLNNKCINNFLDFVFIKRDDYIEEHCRKHIVKDNLGNKYYNTGWGLEDINKLYKKEHPEWDDEKINIKSLIIFNELNKLNGLHYLNTKSYYNNNVHYDLLDNQYIKYNYNNLNNYSDYKLFEDFI